MFLLKLGEASLETNLESAGVLLLLCLVPEVVQRFMLPLRSNKVIGLIQGLGLHVLPMSAWFLSGFSTFLPQSKNMHLRSVRNSELTVFCVKDRELFGVSVCLNVALWWTGEFSSRLLAMAAVIVSCRPPELPVQDEAGVENEWMEVWQYKCANLFPTKSQNCAPFLCLDHNEPPWTSAGTWLVRVPHPLLLQANSGTAGCLWSMNYYFFVQCV